MKILVTGGRHYTDAERVARELSALSPDLVIHGGATGADALANQWAADNNVPVAVYHADWKRYRGGAGPIRNQWMLDDSEPDYVLAFPGGSGTADMVERAEKAGVSVLRPDIARVEFVERASRYMLHAKDCPHIDEPLAACTCGALPGA